jgi:hypothetical protein
MTRHEGRSFEQYIKGTDDSLGNAHRVWENFELYVSSYVRPIYSLLISAAHIKETKLNETIPL